MRKLAAISAVVLCLMIPALLAVFPADQQSGPGESQPGVAATTASNPALPHHDGKVQEVNPNRPGRWVNYSKIDAVPYNHQVESPGSGWTDFRRCRVEKLWRDPEGIHVVILLDHPPTVEKARKNKSWETYVCPDGSPWYWKHLSVEYSQWRNGSICRVSDVDPNRQLLWQANAWRNLDFRDPENPRESQEAMNRRAATAIEAINVNRTDVNHGISPSENQSGESRYTPAEQKRDCPDCPNGGDEDDFSLPPFKVQTENAISEETKVFIGLAIGAFFIGCGLLIVLFTKLKS